MLHQLLVPIRCMKGHSSERVSGLQAIKMYVVFSISKADIAHRPQFVMRVDVEKDEESGNEVAKMNLHATHHLYQQYHFHQKSPCI